MDGVPRLARSARRWGGLLALGALAGVLAFLVLSVRHPTVYRAEATVLIVSGLTGNEAHPDDLGLASALLETDRLTIKSHAVLSDVIGTLHLPTTPALLATQIEVVPVPGTNLLTIAAYYENNADAAAQLANTVAEQFIRRATLDRAAPLAAQRAVLTAQQAANEATLQTVLTRQATLRATTPRSTAAQQELDRLDADIAGYLLTRTDLLGRLSTLARIQALNSVPARLVERAVPPPPIATSGAFSLGVAALTGALAAALVLWALAFAAGTLSGAEEVRSTLQLPVLGVIPRDK
jgi:capsular polysaccharide biosynthesis protein